MKTNSSFFDDLFTTAISRYVKDVRRIELKGGYKLHGTFVSPFDRKEHEFFYRHQKMGAFAPTDFTFQITDGSEGSFYGNIFGVDIYDEGFWCEETEVSAQAVCFEKVNPSREEVRKAFKEFLFEDFI